MRKDPVVGKPPLLRELNQQAILELLRKEGPLSRSALTRRLRLSKSTVSTVVADLIAHGLVRETARAPSRVGRRAKLLDIDPDAGFVVGIDLGGTMVRTAVADLRGEIRAKRREQTTKAGLTALLDQLEASAREVLLAAGVPRQRLLSLAIGVPGAVRLQDRTVWFCPNLPALEGIPLGSLLESRFGVEVLLDNDVNMAAIGEKWRGCARDVQDFVFLAIGTGLGMGLIVGGELYRGTHGFAGEPGYIPVFLNGTWRKLEDLVTGPGIVNLARDLLSRSSAPTVLRGKELTSPEIFQAARAGDPLAGQLVDEVARHIAWGIAVISVIADPSLVVLGGGVGDNPDLLLPRIQRFLGELAPFAPEVKTTALGGEAALLGAIATALRSGRMSLYAPRRRGEARAAAAPRSPEEVAR